jgi:hypothetical protein
MGETGIDLEQAISDILLPKIQVLRFDDAEAIVAWPWPRRRSLPQT